MTLGAVKLPTRAQIAELAQELGFSMSDEELAVHLEAMRPNIDAYNAVDRMPQALPPVRYPRTPGHRPTGEENRYGAWYVKSTIEGAAGGKLEGKRLAIKDNVCIAGVPMMNGASTLEGYVPDVDATIVTRILDAGGTILGKSGLRVFLLLGRQPHQRVRPGAQPAPPGLLGRRLVLGQCCADRCGRGRHGDRRRSGRLDPHPGRLLWHLRHEADPRPRALHRRHADRAHHRSHRADERDRGRQRAPAGSAGRPDGLDPRQQGVEADRYTEALEQGASGLRIALVREGFGHANSQAAVDAKVRKAADTLRGLGATVDEVSIPMHLMGVPIWLPSRPRARPCR